MDINYSPGFSHTEDERLNVGEALKEYYNSEDVSDEAKEFIEFDLIHFYGKTTLDKIKEEIKKDECL